MAGGLGGAQWLRRVLSAPRAAGVAGLLSAFLLTAVFVLFRRGLGGPPTLEIMTAGSSVFDDRQVRLGLLLIPYVAVTFIWFMAVVRLQFAAPENTLFATVFVANGVLLLMCLLVAAALGGGVLDLRTEQLDGRSAAIWLGGASIFELLFGIAPRVTGAFILITANLLRRVRVMPVWMAVVSVVVGVVLLLAVRRVDWAVFLLPSWVAMVSVLILVRDRPVGSPV